MKNSSHPRDLFRDDTIFDSQEITNLPTLRKPSLDAPTRITLPMCSHLADTTIDQNTTQELPTSECLALAGVEELILLDSIDVALLAHFTHNDMDPL